MDIEALEAEAVAARQKVIDAKNEDYVSSGRAAADIDRLYSQFRPSLYGTPQPETLEEKFAAAFKEAKRQADAYVSSLYGGRC